MQILARIKKSERAEIRVVRDTFKNREVIDVRVWFIPEGQTEMVRSRRGVEFDIAKLPDIVEALKQVL